MTTLFEERERAFERLFAHEEELRFLALVRRNRMIGTWIARRIGLSEAEAEEYTRRLVETVAIPLTDEALVARLRADLDARGVEVHDLPGLVARCAAEAAREVRAA
ncbi:MAG: DUF1476 domain-containing protein [Methylobacterium sp.]|uniref:DUF1476 domain-containing protein n=1 Tax=Methylobacterium sp. TaxID=409 RepID=UPI00258EF9AB|nr:DUF1476 domain-containing protein [Methylobacterium sp.]MBY0298416.1 DUF1476 domain-containing protein [Methylobacterium sp.]